MKKIFLFVVFSLIMMSCKDVSTGKESESIDNKVIVGGDRDEQGCIASAGYRWSVLMNKCIRVFEEGFRLNPIDTKNPEDATMSVFVVFEENENKAELFIPGKRASVILERESEEKPFIGEDWLLFSSKEYVLKKGNIIKYTSASVIEKKEIGDDKSED